jgi:hypothetical protein
MMPFFYERGTYKEMLVGVLLMGAIAGSRLAKAWWCLGSEDRTFTMEDHVLLVLSFAFFNMFFACGLVAYFSSTILRILNLVEEENGVGAAPETTGKHGEPESSKQASDRGR